MSAQRTYNGPASASATLADDVFAARRHVREQEATLKREPSYLNAVGLQILKRHWRDLRTFRVVA